MLTREQVLDIALSLPGAAADQPFEGDFDSTVLRHGGTGKWFGLLMRAPRDRVGLSGEGQAEVLNLKCDPLLGHGLAEAQPDIRPAWHMNKHHWITVRLEGEVTEDQLRGLIELSYRLTLPKPPRRGGGKG